MLKFTYDPADQFLILTGGRDQVATRHYDTEGRVKNKVDATSLYSVALANHFNIRPTSGSGSSEPERFD